MSKGGNFRPYLFVDVIVNNFWKGVLYMVSFREGYNWDMTEDPRFATLFVLDNAEFDIRDPSVSMKRKHSIVSGANVYDFELVKKDDMDRETQYAKFSVGDDGNGQMSDLRHVKYASDGTVLMTSHKHYIGNKFYSLSWKEFERDKDGAVLTHGRYTTDYGHVGFMEEGISRWNDASHKETHKTVRSRDGHLLSAERTMESYDPESRFLLGVSYDKKTYNRTNGNLLSKESSYTGTEKANFVQEKYYRDDGLLRKERSSSKMPGTYTTLKRQTDLVQSQSGLLMHDTRLRKEGANGELYSETCELKEAMNRRSLYEHHISPRYDCTCIRDKYGFYGGDARVIVGGRETTVPVDEKDGKISVSKLYRSFGDATKSRSYGEKVSDRFSSLVNKVKGVSEPEYPF